MASIGRPPVGAFRPPPSSLGAFVRPRAALAGPLAPRAPALAVCCALVWRRRQRTRPRASREVFETRIFQRLLQPSVAKPWIFLGDLLTCGLAAPLFSTFYLRVGVLQPDWFEKIADTEKDFIFPEFSHGLIFSLCWCIGAMAIGAFESDAVSSKNLLKTIRCTALAAATTGWLSSVSWSILNLSGSLEEAYALTGYYAPVTHAMPSYTDFFIDLQFEALLLIAWRFTAAVVFSEKTVENEDENEIDGRLLMGDVLVSGLITPALIIEVFFKTQTYTPLWTAFWDVTEYGIGKPIAAHGFILAICWLAGAFTAGAYSKDAMEPIDLPSILKRLWTAGIVATLLLFMFNTLSASFSETTDVVAAFDPNVLLQKRLFDFTSDVVFAALAITSWRLYFGGYI